MNEKCYVPCGVANVIQKYLFCQNCLAFKQLKIFSYFLNILKFPYFFQKKGKVIVKELKVKNQLLIFSYLLRTICKQLWILSSHFCPPGCHDNSS